MNINITCKLLKEFHQVHEGAQMETAGWHEADDRKKSVNISKLKSEELDTLAKLAEECKDETIGWNILNKIRSLRQLRQDPLGKKITKLDALDTAIKTYLKDVAPSVDIFKKLAVHKDIKAS